MDTVQKELILPWSILSEDVGGDHVYIIDGDQYQVVRLHKSQTDIAVRVAACVNACRGISTEDLKKSNFGDDSVEVGTLLGQTMQQRDELLDALNQIAIGHYVEGEEREIASAAIVKATGDVMTDSDGGHCD